MIRAYPSTPVVRSGEALELCVSGTASSFAVRFVRCGNRCDAVDTYADSRFPLQDIAPGAAGEPWNWPVYRFTIPDHWTSGAYAALLLEDGMTPALRSSGSAIDARSHRALFVVRPPTVRAELLVVLPLFTYQAYNVANVDGTRGEDEGESLYSGAPWVTLHRPGGGIGGHPWDEVNADAYDPMTPRQTFAHWDLKALAWLESSGYAYDLCTDLELHIGDVPLDQYRVVASFGHHEYWTAEMRERIDRFATGGGHVAFFGGNTMWFRAEYDAERTAIRRDDRWNDEWKMTGVTYACGGGRWIGERPAAIFRVKDGSHEIFAGTQLANGDAFGVEANVVGYECDGANDPSDLTVLAEASLEAWPLRDECGERAPNGRASLGLRRHGRGAVFTASTADWARAMGSDHCVSRITRNVLNTFGLRPMP